MFKNYQDAFAMQEYYSSVESQLRAWGINLEARPYVVRGAVFSYAIQHGSYTAAMAVRDAKITNATTNENFIKKLYKYRISKYPTYRSQVYNGNERRIGAALEKERDCPKHESIRVLDQSLFPGKTNIWLISGDAYVM